MSLAAAVRPLAALAARGELVWLLVLRDLKGRYKRSLLGMAWTLANPLLQMLVYTLVFSVIVRVRVPDYPVYVLSGLLPWTLVSVSTVASTYALLANQSLIRKVAVPQAVYPLALVGGKTVDLCLSLLPLAVVASFQGHPPGVAWLFLPVSVVLAVAFTAGLALVAASATVFFRDLRHLAEIGFQVWFYLTPILYPPSFLDSVDHRLRLLLAANPATPIVRLFQAPLYEGRFPTPTEALAALGVAALSLTVGLVAFHRAEDAHLHWL